MPSCNFCSPDSPYSLLMFDSSSSCHNTCSSQNRVPIFIPLLYFSSIIRVFINSPLEKSQSPNLTSLEKSPLHQLFCTVILISQHLARLPVLRFVKIGLYQFSLYTSNSQHDRVSRVSQFCFPKGN